MTNRLCEQLQTIGFATCGQLGERLAPKLGMSVSGPTLLRRMRTVSIPPPASVRVLGIDDWAWKKGQTYGTILVDLERRRTIDLLPDRSTETVEAWLRAHPEVEIVSRDRGTEYAAVQMEREHGHFRKKYWPLFTPYCQKKNPSNQQFGRNSGRNY